MTIVKIFKNAERQHTHPTPTHMYTKYQIVSKEFLTYKLLSNPTATSLAPAAKLPTPPAWPTSQPRA